jgi:hypothetical protein
LDICWLYCENDIETTHLSQESVAPYVVPPWLKIDINSTIVQGQGATYAACHLENLYLRPYRRAYGCSPTRRDLVSSYPTSPSVWLVEEVLASFPLASQRTFLKDDVKKDVYISGYWTYQVFADDPYASRRHGASQARDM